MSAKPNGDEDAAAAEQLKVLLEKAAPLVADWRGAYEKRLDTERAARDQEIEKFKTRLPFNVAIVRRRDWIGVWLASLMILGALGATAWLLYKDHVPEALQVLSLMVGWFAGRASRNGGETPSQKP